MNRRILRLLCAVLLGVAACSPEQTRTIGLSMHFMRDDYAVKLVDTVRHVLEREAEFRLIVTDANAAPQKQLADIENLVVQNVAAIIVVPIDEKAILPAIEKANARNIPVVAITKIPDAEVLTTVGATSDYANGRASGELLAEATSGKGKLAMIGIQYSLWRIDQREQGFFDAIRDTDLEVVARQSGLDQARVQDTVAGILVAHPDLAGIWCTFSNQIVGAADALRAAGRRDIVLTGIDADKAIIERIREGWITGTAAQFPVQQGRLAVQAVLDHFQGNPVATSYEVPTGLVRKDNVDEMNRMIWGE